MLIFRWARQIYDRTLQLSGHRHAPRWLAAISFAESSFFLIPPDVLLIPMCLANRKRAFFLALLCTAASVIGGVVGYLIGAFAFESIGMPILEFYGVMEKYALLQQWYEEWGGVIVFVAGLTPIPYKVITISSGVFHFNILPFLIFSLAARGLRFFAEAALIWKFGEPAVALIDKHFEKIAVASALLLIGGFVLVKFLIPEH